VTRFVDVRGTRFAGILTFLTALAAGIATLWWLAAIGAVVLFAAAWGGPRWNLWSRFYRVTIAPRLAPPKPATRNEAERRPVARQEEFRLPGRLAAPRQRHHSRCQAKRNPLHGRSLRGLLD
jgi:hypothetical protein